MSNNIGRRDFLGTIVFVGAAAAAGRTSLIDSAEATTASSDGITSSSASELAEAVRSKKWNSKEIVEAHLDRIAKVNPKLNAVVQLTAEAARKEADEADVALARGEIKGPLHGVPVTIKDTLETAGVICTGGTKGRANYLPKADATAVARLRAAGGIILGKTNVPELAGAAETDNLVYGRTNNPYDLARTPGGSSGGEAAIIAARRSVSAPTPVVASASLRIIAGSRPSNLPRAACRGPGNFRCHWARATRCFTSA
jgi:amidase